MKYDEWIVTGQCLTVPEMQQLFPHAKQESSKNHVQCNKVVCVELISRMIDAFQNITAAFIHLKEKYSVLQQSQLNVQYS